MIRNEAKVWNRFSGIYDTFMKKDMLVYKEMIERMKERLEPRTRVLEIATGTGILSLGIAEIVKSVESVDLSPDMIARAHKKRDIWISPMYTFPFRTPMRSPMMLAALMLLLSPTRCMLCRSLKRHWRRLKGC